MKRVLFFGLIVLATTARVHAGASAAKVTVKNNSEGCAWVTYYTSVPLMPWIQQHAVSIRPGASDDKRYTFFAPSASPVPAPVPGQVRVRVEFFAPKKGCEGQPVADKSAEKGLLLAGKEEFVFVLKSRTDMRETSFPTPGRGIPTNPIPHLTPITTYWIETQP